MTAVLDDFFGTLGIDAAQGRCLKGAETGGEFVGIAVLSHELWQSAFQGSADIIGQQIQLDGASITVIGVMPERFQFPDLTDVWIPFQITLPMRYDWDSLYLRVAIRARAGSTVEEVGSQALEIVHWLDGLQRGGSPRRTAGLELIAW